MTIIKEFFFKHILTICMPSALVIMCGEYYLQLVYPISKPEFRGKIERTYIYVIYM